MVSCSTQNPQDFWHENLYRGMQATHVHVLYCPTHNFNSLVPMQAGYKAIVYLISLLARIKYSLGQSHTYFSIAPARTLLHNYYDSQSSSVLCHSVELVPTSTPFFPGILSSWNNLPREASQSNTIMYYL